MMYTDQPKTSTLAKRGKPSYEAAAEDKPAKKVKTESANGGNASAEVQSHYSSGSLSKLTVAVLKEFLTEKKLSAAGKKADLVERVEEYFDRKG